MVKRAADSGAGEKVAREGSADGARDNAGIGAFIGATLRRERLAQHLTMNDVAELSAISAGMLSRIENAQTMPSLDTLERVCRALGLSLSSLFKNYDLPEGVARYVPAGQGMQVVRRGTRRGHDYELLAYDVGPRKLFEPFLITMDDQSEVFPRFQHPGLEFIHLLEGRLEYRHGKQLWTLGPGDSLSFQGEVPHGPERLLEVPIRMLCVIVYGEPE